MKTIAVGPYFGDFTTEILSFRPYVYWLYSNLEYDNFFVSSHVDRQFLYHWVSDEAYIPLLSQTQTDQRDKQFKYHYIDIEFKKYLKYQRIFRSKVAEMVKIPRKEVRVFMPSYSKLQDPVSFFKKRFCRIQIPKIKAPILSFCDEHLDVEYDKVDEADPYHKIVSRISGSKCVFAPLGIWTVIANLQKIPVFSYGIEDLSKFKPDGDYYFNNINCRSIYAYNTDKIDDKIKKYFYTFLKELDIKNADI